MSKFRAGEPLVVAGNLSSMHTLPVGTLVWCAAEAPLFSAYVHVYAEGACTPAAAPRLGASMYLVRVSDLEPLDG